MKTSRSIKMTYNNAIRDSRALSDIADKIVNQKKSLEECVNTLQSKWKGDSGNLYRKKIDDRIRELDQMIKDLRLISKTIIKVAKSAHDADMKAIELAKQRTYGGGGHF